MQASACALKVAHRNAACVVQAGVHISCVSTRFLSFLICSSRTGHPTEVFRSTRVCSSRTCAQATSACLGNRVPARISSSVSVVARVLPCTSGRALAYFHIPVIAASFVQAGHSLDKTLCQSLPRFHAPTHQWFDGPAQVTRFKHFVEVVLN